MQKVHTENLPFEVTPLINDTLEVFFLSHALEVVADGKGGQEGPSPLPYQRFTLHPFQKKKEEPKELIERVVSCNRKVQKIEEEERAGGAEFQALKAPSLTPQVIGEGPESLANEEKGTIHSIRVGLHP